MASSQDLVTPGDPHWRWAPEVEEFLDQIGVEYVRRSGVDIHRIDKRRSLQNNARFTGKEDQSKIEDFVYRMQRGSTFPALVAYAIGDVYVLHGGNHRLCAALIAGWPTVDLYELAIEDEGKRHLVTTSLNTLEGDRTIQDENVQHAVFAVETYRYSVEGAAKHYGVKARTIETELAKLRARRVFHDARVSTEGLTLASIERLSKIDNNIVLDAAATLQRRIGLVDYELARMLSEVKEQRTEATQVAVIARWGKREYGGHPGPAPVDPAIRTRIALLRALSAATSALSKATSRGPLGLSGDEDYRRVLGLARGIVTTLEDVNGTPI